jgi:hypothetical protein
MELARWNGETWNIKRTRLLVQLSERWGDNDRDHSINYYSAGSGPHLSALTDYVPHRLLQPRDLLALELLFFVASSIAARSPSSCKSRSGLTHSPLQVRCPRLKPDELDVTVPRNRFPDLPPAVLRSTFDTWMDRMEG